MQCLQRRLDHSARIKQITKVRFDKKAKERTSKAFESSNVRLQLRELELTGGKGVEARLVANTLFGHWMSFVVTLLLGGTDVGDEGVTSM